MYDISGTINNVILELFWYVVLKCGAGFIELIKIKWDHFPYLFLFRAGSWFTKEHMQYEGFIK